MATGSATSIGFAKDELSFVKEIPEHVEIECPVCLQVMLTEPHQVSCCGHNFCGPCIERVKASSGSCPLCKEKNFQSFVDKKCLRTINGLQVYCTNKEKGCQWNGELRNLSTHLNQGKREGECRFEEVKCRYEKCQERKQRQHLDEHEKNDCPQRPYQCQYCSRRGTYQLVTEEHYPKCPQYPVPCPNKCLADGKKFPRAALATHLNTECPLQSVECMFSWAGCTDKPLRKDSQQHTTDPKHMSLLAAACGELKETCGQLKRENEKLAVACGELKKENEALAHQLKTRTHQIHYAIVGDSYPILPVDVRVNNTVVHFYTDVLGYHMSIKACTCIDLFKIGGVKSTMIQLAFHEGKYAKHQLQVSKIYARQGNGEAFLLLDDTEADYQTLPPDILNYFSHQEGVLTKEFCFDFSEVTEKIITIY